ncbi:hypothetical protein HYW21_03845 [Candidatus Woesearchaeota archaeon]|nr:hypothetical protein [Candidatus Woesearchaeota archaeon]
MSNKNLLLASILIIGLFVLVGCSGENGSTASPNENSQPEEKSNEHIQKEVLATAVKAYVDASSKNWDEDLQDDGIIVYPELKDASDNVVKFEGIELKVDIEIWTKKLNEDFKEVKDRNIYNGSGIIDTWKDGNFMFDGGIKIPFDDIKVIESDRDYGELYVKIHANEKVYEAKSLMGVRIKPESE